jgi:hypothetical protein
VQANAQEASIDLSNACEIDLIGTTSGEKNMKNQAGSGHPMACIGGAPHLIH